MSGKPTLAVVIATLGRNTLLPTVRSLLSARGSDDTEIVVVGTIADPTMAEELRQLTATHRRVKHLALSFNSGDSSNKKNAGFRATSADIVAFVDDDVIVAPDWPARILEAFGTANVGMVSGPSLVPDDLPLMPRLAGCALSSPAAGYVASRYLKDSGGPRRIRWSGIIGCNMAFRRAALERAGLFDPRFWPGEEMIVSAKVEKLGFGIVFAPDAWLYHYPRGTLGGFALQIYKYGATRIRLIRQGVDLEPVTLMPAFLLFSMIALAFGSFYSRWACYLLAAQVAAYLLSSAVVTLAVVWRTKRASDLLVFFMIPVMHMSYAIAQWVEAFWPGRDLSVQRTPQGMRV